MLDPVWASRDARRSHFRESDSQSHHDTCRTSGTRLRRMAEEEEDTPEIFIDRDPKTFGVLLNFLRSGVLNIPSGVTVDAVLSDADYLGLLDAVKSALLPPALDANEMHKVSGLELPCNTGGRNTGGKCDVGIVGVSVKGALLPPALDANEMHRTSVLRPNVGPADVCTALAAHEDGSVDVAHGARVTCYDWMLRHTATIITDLPQVDTICRLSESRIIVGGGKGCYHLPIYDTRGYESSNTTPSAFDDGYLPTPALSASYTPSLSSHSSSHYSSPCYSSLSHYGSPAALPSLSPSSLSSYTPSPLTLTQPPPSSSISPIILPQSASHYPTPTTNPLYSPPLHPSLLPSSSTFPSPYATSPFPPTCKIGSVALRGASHPSFRSIVQSDRFLFVASLRKTLGVEWGVGKAVGVVDRGTLQSVGEAGPAPITTRRMGGPDKLQWLSSRNLLMVARRYTPSVQGGSEGPSYLRLWDPRCNQLVWDWREFDDPQPSLVPSDRWCALCDATACEDLSLLLKASPSAPDSSSRLSAFDLRKLPLPAGNSAGALGRWASMDEEKLGGAFSVGGGQGGIGGIGGMGGFGGAGGGGGGGGGDDAWGGYLRGALTPGSLTAAAAAARGFEPPPLEGTGARNTGDEVAAGVDTLTSAAAAAAAATGAGSTGGSSHGNSIAAAAAPPPTRFDPYSFRKTYGDTMGEYQRRRVNFEAPPDHWVYDMAFGGNRLFLARDDQRPGGSGLGSIEVWETRTNHRVGP
ncbi:unnamed protein product [Closterium sp. Naga37s-1]|nr:unnamed protein product [Closterium sp. Naga37s-1]